MSELPPGLLALMAIQFGLVTRSQVLSHVSEHQERLLLRTGVLFRTADTGVYQFVGRPSSFRVRARGLTLAHPGLVMSHLAAAYLLKAESVAEPGLEAFARRGRGPSNRPEVVIHHGRLPATDVTDRRGIPITKPPRTIIDLSTVIVPSLLKTIYDDLVRAKRMQPRELEVRLGRGDLPKLALPQLEGLLGREVGASPREDWMVDTIVGAGLPYPERNVIVEADGRLWELDCAYRTEMVAIEYQGRRVHGDNSGLDRDPEKLATLALAGWLVLPVTSAWSEAKLIRRVRAALQQRRL